MKLYLLIIRPISHESYRNQTYYTQVEYSIIWLYLPFTDLYANFKPISRPVPKYWKNWFRLPWKVYTWNYYEGLEGSFGA